MFSKNLEVSGRTNTPMVQSASSCARSRLTPSSQRERPFRVPHLVGTPCRGPYASSICIKTPPALPCRLALTHHLMMALIGVRRTPMDYFRNIYGERTSENSVITKFAEHSFQALG